MHAIRDNTLVELTPGEPYDLHLEHPSQQYSASLNNIPLQGSVQTPRLFYGNRFDAQAVAHVFGEQPLVQNLDTSDARGRSFDEVNGERAGIKRAPHDGEVTEIGPHHITVKGKDSTTKVDLYHHHPSNQKSVSGETDILIQRAGGKIWRGPIKDYVWEDGDLVPSYDPATFRSAWQRVLCKVSHANDKRLQRVEFSSGRSVVVTEDHSLLRFDGHKIVGVVPGECEVGRTRSPVGFGVLPDSEEQTNDLAWGTLVGLYLAEGNLPMGSRKRKDELYGSVCIAVKPFHRQDQIRDLLRELGFTPHNCNPAGGKVTFQSHWFSAWLEKHCGRGSGNKFIHPDILSRSSAFRLGVLQGFMAGDGCMESDRNGAIHVHSAVISKRLRDDLVLLIQGFGIFATLFFAGRKRYSDKWNDAYGFLIMSKHLCKLPRWFFYEDRHQNFLKWVSDRYDRTSPFERIEVPIQRACHATLEPLGLDGIREDSNNRRSRVRQDGTTHGLCISKKYAIAASTPPYALLGASDMMWDKIVLIEDAPHEDEVYDLSVENSEAFAVCGGLLVHNSAVHNTPVVEVGAKVSTGDLLAKSNFTDGKGVLNMGTNALVGLVPHRGHTMDDALEVSQAYADRMTSDHYKVLVHESNDGRKHSLSHYRSLFPTAYDQKMLERFDEHGIIKPGTVVSPNDPLVLTSSPRAVSSKGAGVSRLTRALSESRRDDSMIWDGRDDATVIDARKTKDGVKVFLHYASPLRPGDKIVGRPGAKGTVARIIPTDQMPRTGDGKPLDLLLNPLSLFSRANPSTSHELRLGKIAEKLGKPLKLPSYLPPGQNWNDYISQLEQEHGVNSMETVFDPESGRSLDQPVAVGRVYFKKLHHVSSAKVSDRGTGGYSNDEMPLKGGFESAQAKRFSGLENVAALSAGAYGVMRENSTIKGQKNDLYHRALRSAQPLPRVGEPFVWHKFRHLLAGAGIRTRDLGGGRIRLAPMTDKHLARLDPVDVKHGGTIDLRTFEPEPDGLFDSRISNHDRWGRITLPRPVINPAYEESVRTLLGLTKPALEAVLAGRATVDGKPIDTAPVLD